MSQALTPEDLETAEFHVTVRGYARDEVHEVLKAAAAVIKDLQEKVETGYLNLGERMGELLQQAKDGADELLASAQAAATRTEEEARTRAADILQTAENHAAKIVREAEERVAELRAIEGEISGALQSLRMRLEGVAEGFLGREPVDADHS